MNIHKKILFLAVTSIIPISLRSITHYAKMGKNSQGTGIICFKAGKGYYGKVTLQLKPNSLQTKNEAILLKADRYGEHGNFIESTQPTDTQEYDQLTILANTLARAFDGGTKESTMYCIQCFLKKEIAKDKKHNHHKRHHKEKEETLELVDCDKYLTIIDKQTATTNKPAESSYGHVHMKNS